MSGNTAESAGTGYPAHKERTSVSVTPNTKDVLAVAFDLGTSDLQVYHALLDLPNGTTQELAGTVGIDRSNVNRSLGQLRECDLVNRRRRILPEGGHCYVYTATEVEEGRELLREKFDVWAEQTRDELLEVLVPDE